MAPLEADRNLIAGALAVALLVGGAAILLTGSEGGSEAEEEALEEYSEDPEQNRSKDAGRTTDSDDGFQDTGSSLIVDEEVTPEQETMPPGPGREDPRPVGRIEDAEGSGSDVVEDEVVVIEDRETVEDLVDRWDAERLERFDPGDLLPNSTEDDADTSGDALPGIRYRLKLNLSRIDPAELHEDLDAVHPEDETDYRVSDEATRNLAAAVLSAQREGLHVGFNWVYTGDTFEDDQSNEAGSTDAFDWTYLSPKLSSEVDRDVALDTHGHLINHNVTEAWTALERAGKLDETVDVAIIDGGFVDADDLPPATVVDTVGVGPTTAFGCGDGNPCPWHGTRVASAAMSLPDNGNGSAGPAGPVASAHLIHWDGTHFSLDNVIRVATDVSDADIISMSLRTERPDIGRAGERQVNDATNHAWDQGTLIFASAGNDGKDVDEDRVFNEKRKHYPCEAPKVICVGGLSLDATTSGAYVAHTDSNYGSGEGSNTVELWAPYCVRTVKPPTGTGSTVPSGVPPGWAWTCGTSVSTPFTAGIAALVKAGDPSLEPAEIQDILYETAYPGFGDVDLVVNAQGAVREALGGDLPPRVEITRPADGATLDAGVRHYMTAEVEDPDDDPRDLEVQWYSDRDGLVGEGLSPDVCLGTVGEHELTVSTGSPWEATDTVTVTLRNLPPDATINSPSDGETFTEGQTVIANAEAWDPNADPCAAGSLPGDRFDWRLNDGDGWRNVGTDDSIELKPSAGEYTLCATAHDEHGATDDACVDFVVEASEDDNTPPTARIVSPDNGAEFHANEYSYVYERWYADVTLEGTAEDPDSEDTHEFSWSTDPEGHDTRNLGDGAQRSTRLFMYDSCTTTHELTLEVEDSDGATDEHTIEVEVYKTC